MLLSELSVGSVPLHPLVVHAAVILLPVAAVIAAVLIFVPSSRNNWTLAGLLGFTSVGLAAVWAAEYTGEALAADVGYPGVHAELGEQAVIAATLFALFVAGWVFLMVRRPRRRLWLIFRSRVFPVFMLITGAVTVFAIVQAGHSGAVATWESRMIQETSSPIPVQIEETDPVEENVADPVKEPESEVETVPVALSAENVINHFNTALHCYTVINNNVYDLSGVFASHPGGAQAILFLCGMDGTSGFEAQHGGREIPERELEERFVGEFGSTVELPLKRLPESYVAEFLTE